MNRFAAPVTAMLTAALVAISALTIAACDSVSASAPPGDVATTRAPVAEAAPLGEGEPAAAPPAAAPPAAAPAAVEDDTVIEPAPVLNRRSRFLGELDHTVREALRAGEIAEIERGHGGRSLAFKITLVDGTQGYFKPEQSFSAAHYYSELAAYYLDRELGLGRVPPAIGRVMEWAPLREAAAGDERIDEVAVQEDGTVRGAFIWWIPERLARIQPGRRWDKWIRQEGSLLISPYQRPREWSNAHLPTEGPLAEDEADTEDRVGELADMILFDYLTTNVDRWGGNFTNVRTRGEGGPLIYLDNGAGFTAGPRARVPLMDARLHALQRFRRETVDQIRDLDQGSLEARMAQDPLAPFLRARHYDHLFARRAHLLEHVEELSGRYGAAIWL
ncbi:MAG: hypothetical protein JRH11_07480 [Deltaproteobacteria bacterium]|nr:hypothetical protein [Deltaproteobacteria bacterium]